MGLYLNESWRLKSYGSTSRNGRASVRIEIETSDFGELGFFLQQLAEIDARQSSGKKRPGRPAPLALPAPGGN